jgi:large subunit ribosomal protein L10
VPATRIRPDKAAAVAEIVESFRSSSAALLTEYRGLTVAEIAELRRALGGGASYAVVKNTLTKIAASQAGVEGLDALLAGPTAIAFVGGDPVEAAKGLRDFARIHPNLVIKGGVLDGRPLSAEEIAKLADLESREVLLAKLAGALLASLSQAVGLFAAPLSQMARLGAALQEQKAAEPQPAAADGDAPAAVEDTAAPEAAAADADASEAAPAADAAPTDEASADEAPTEAAPSEESAEQPTEG